MRTLIIVLVCLIATPAFFLVQEWITAGRMRPYRRRSQPRRPGLDDDTK